MNISSSSMSLVGHWHRVNMCLDAGIRKRGTADSVPNWGVALHKSVMAGPQVPQLQNEDLDDF